MPEVSGQPPSPRTALFWNGTAWQWALVDAAGHIQIDVLSSVMDAAAATAANQALILAQLQLIEDMRDALQSVATDRLIVRGEDQLFSFREILISATNAVISGADGWIQCPLPGVGTIWVVTNVITWDATSPTTGHEMQVRSAGVNYEFHDQQQAFAAGDRSEWGGHVYLDRNSRVRVYYAGGLVGDTCNLQMTGYIMTLET